MKFTNPFSSRTPPHTENLPTYHSRYGGYGYPAAPPVTQRSRIGRCIAVGVVVLLVAVAGIVWAVTLSSSEGHQPPPSNATVTSTPGVHSGTGLVARAAPVELHAPEIVVRDRICEREQDCLDIIERSVPRLENEFGALAPPPAVAQRDQLCERGQNCQDVVDTAPQDVHPQAYQPASIHDSVAPQSSRSSRDELCEREDDCAEVIDTSTSRQPQPIERRQVLVPDIQPSELDTDGDQIPDQPITFTPSPLPPLTKRGGYPDTDHDTDDQGDKRPLYPWMKGLFYKFPFTDTDSLRWANHHCKVKYPWDRACQYWNLTAPYPLTPVSPGTFPEYETKQMQAGIEATCAPTWKQHGPLPPRVIVFKEGDLEYHCADRTLYATVPLEVIKKTVYPIAVDFKRWKKMKSCGLRKDGVVPLTADTVLNCATRRLEDRMGEYFCKDWPELEECDPQRARKRPGPHEPHRPGEGTKWRAGPHRNEYQNGTKWWPPQYKNEDEHRGHWWPTPESVRKENDRKEHGS